MANVRTHNSIPINISNTFIAQGVAWKRSRPGGKKRTQNYQCWCQASGDFFITSDRKKIAIAALVKVNWCCPAYGS